MRKRRQYSETGLYHIVIRGVNKQNIFFDDEDKKLFIQLLKKYSRKHNILIHAYCLMDNHVHLELQDTKSNISIFMQSLCSLYARIFNKKYDRIGHLFQERYASECILDKQYFLTVFQYIMQNPKKACLSKNLNYKWSSYKLYKKLHSFVQTKLLIHYLGNIDNLYKFLEQESITDCLEIELRPSERENKLINEIKALLKADSPLIKPDLPKHIILSKLAILKKAGFSIRTISRITGIGKYLIQIA